MLWKILTVAALTLAGVAVVTAGITLGQLSSGRSQLSATRSQLAQARTQLGTMRTQLAGVNAQAKGLHRDLITCGDLQELGWQVTGSDSAGGNLQGAFAGPGPVSLPQHCINR
jgi:hypothetical protein